MGFTLTITGDTGSELLNLLRSLSPAETLAIVPQEGTTTLPVKKEKKGTATETPAEKPTVPAATGDKITIEQVRAAVQAKATAGKRDGIKEVLTSFGAEKVPDLKEEQYAEVIEKINAL